MNDIASGREIVPADIRPRRIDASIVDPKTLLGPDMEDRIVGSKAARDIPAGTPLTQADIEPAA